ncbi:hypothetical protein [Granulicella arctica]|uniref:Uncharacterized protein n=1 Tax=Granulicella arctica TaxID=940613 RepID=A0A7Y9TUA7_9BACT|nr:hypothetical protein [Granulicella arctica]NYF80743.1 hypothetical protein [Granulicella arctica]
MSEMAQNKKRVSLAAGIFLGAAMILSGCKHSTPTAGVKNADGSITNADGSVTYPAGTTPAPAAPAGTLNSDGSTTNPDGSVTYPAGSARARQETASSNGSAPAPAPSQPAPIQQQAPPPPPPPVAKVVPSGTSVHVTITETLSASQNNVGDSFSGVLNQSIRVGGAPVFDRGTRVAGTVVASKHKGRFKGAGDLGIQITSIGGVPVNTTEFEAVAKGNGKRTAGIIGGGTGLGAIIGGLAGGGKGALIGGLAGAGAGTAGAAYTGSRDVVIRSETPVTFQLTSPVTVR